uniref:Uncharacterized protein n=1 Tax=Amorphochlora amoebiformis TaxID=1561963 RepID=A0A7S0DI84_9EUKA|mmetsp:Transcript_28902/g.46197  ORF Transcript_28902/g.46197 Transcript_28902/m.46197 type:complete len:118 (+) Transcript_28902:57-410(+)
MTRKQDMTKKTLEKNAIAVTVRGAVKIAAETEDEMTTVPKERGEGIGTGVAVEIVTGGATAEAEAGGGEAITVDVTADPEAEIGGEGEEALVHRLRIARVLRTKPNKTLQVLPLCQE